MPLSACLLHLHLTGLRKSSSRQPVHSPPTVCTKAPFHLSVNRKGIESRLLSVHHHGVSMCISAPMQGFEKTGLGRRVATIFVKWFGKSTLGLAYGLAAAEALLAPAMPSTTARAGGIFMPIINSLSRTAGSMPGEPFSVQRPCKSI